MANQDSSILRTEENGVEYFTVIATGKSAVSERGLSRASGIPRKTLAGWLHSLGENKPVKYLESLRGNTLYLGEPIKKNGKSIKAIVSDAAEEIIWIAATELNKKEAKAALNAYRKIGFESYIQGKTGWLPKSYQSSQSARQKISRIMDNHCPWEKLYERDMCLKIQKWYGFNCTKFYWWYCYSWLTPEEKCKLEEVNPVLTLVSKNGKQRTSRKRKIHQHLDKETRTRLIKLVQDLYSCIRFSRSRIDFERSWNAEYGAPEQLEIFDLWDFAS